MSNGYVLLPRVVSQGFRELIQRILPVLGGTGPVVRALWAMLQYVLYVCPVYRDGRRQLILPHETVAALVGANACSGRFRSGAWFELFNKKLFPLRESGWNYSKREARVIDPLIPEEIHAARDHEVLYGIAKGDEHVLLIDGTNVSQRRYERLIRQYKARMLEQAAEGRADHPAASLLQYLNTNGHRSFARTVRANLPNLFERASELSPGPQRDVVMRVLAEVQECPMMLYGTSERTTRVHALGSTVHLLPREFRKLALSGCIHLDLQACQLAIVAVLWEIPTLQKFLARKKQSIWTMLLEYLSLPPSYKSILKTTLYSLLFGMGKRRLMRQLAEGDGSEQGIGNKKARRFKKHPLIAELLEARSKARRRVTETGGAEDAFGEWISKRDYNARSVLAQTIQSWELKLMMAVLPIIEGEKDAWILSWLHDGIAVKVGDPTKKERVIRKLCDAVEDEARKYGFQTRLEVET
jgi:hypothetical protein